VSSPVPHDVEAVPTAGLNRSSVPPACWPVSRNATRSMPPTSWSTNCRSRRCGLRFDHVNPPPHPPPPPSHARRASIRCYTSFGGGPAEVVARGGGLSWNTGTEMRPGRPAAKPIPRPPLSAALHRAAVDLAASKPEPGRRPERPSRRPPNDGLKYSNRRPPRPRFFHRAPVIDRSFPRLPWLDDLWGPDLVPARCKQALADLGGLGPRWLPGQWDLGPKGLTSEPNPRHSPQALQCRASSTVSR